MATTVLVTHPGAELYGSDRVLLESVDAFVGAGFEVVVTLPATGPLVGELERRRVDVVLCRTPVLRKSLLSAGGLVGFAASVVRAAGPGWRLMRTVRPDVVYVSTITTPLWLLLARLARVPSVCHVHEAEASARPVLRKALVLPLLLATGLLANSRFSLGVVTGAFPALGRRSRVVYNAVQGPGTATPPRPSPDDGLRVLYVGRLSQRKGVHVAVEAAGLLAATGRGIQLDVVGDVFAGNEAYRESLQQRAEQLGTDVRFHAFQPDVWPFMARADVLVVPSTVDEPFGNTAVEGVLACRPVVASATSGLLEAVDGLRSTTSVRPGDPADLAAALRSVAGRWTELLERLPGDRETVLRRHSTAAYRAQVVGAVAELVR